MKTYRTIILTLILASACTKSSVTYMEPGTMTIQPVSEGMTKAAVGAVPTDQELYIYANYTEGKPAGTRYLDKAVFAQDGTSGIWKGVGQDYFWPKSGKITLSGCTAISKDVNYSYQDNTIKILDYQQSLDPSETVDFLWFNQTPATNLDRATQESLPVTMNHALTWVTIKASGFGGSIGWKIKSITLKGVKDKGALTCKTVTTDSGSEAVAEWTGTTWTEADWQENNTQQFKVFKAQNIETDCKILAADAQDIENVSGGTVLIPQTPVKMEVEYQAGSAWKTKELDLMISTDPDKNFWEAGKHYIYSITFNPYKITFTVTENTWENGNPVDENGVPKDDIDVDSYKDSEINP